MAQQVLGPESFTTFGELLRHLRRRAHLTQREFGSAVGYSFSTICKLEANDRLPDVAIVRARFVEGLGLQHEPTLAIRLVELAQASHTHSAAGMAMSWSAAEGEPLMPLIGRHAELQQLREALSRTAATGKSQVALIAGEAGIGKTRLAEEVLALARRQGFVVATAHSYAAEGALPYAPVRAWLRADVFANALPMLEPVWLTEVARLVPEVLAARSDLPAPGPLGESWQRQRFFEALARAVLSIPVGSHAALGRPVLLFLDDLQWTDRETLEWLRFLLHADLHASLLLLGTVRSEEVTAGHPIIAFVEAAQRSGELLELELGRLTLEETAAIAAQVAGCAFTPEQAGYLYHETEGNPLFAVEIAHSTDWRAWRTLPLPGSQDHAPLTTAYAPRIALPATVQSVISHRLNQLSPEAIALAGLAATVGREFTFDVLAAATGEPDETLVGTLDELLQRRIVCERAAQADQPAYDFSHDKIREAAYASVSVAHRRVLHRHVGEALAAVYAQSPNTVSAQIAAHLDQAGLPEQALFYYVRAAEVSQHVYANAEAIRYYRRALELLEREPGRGPEREPQGISATDEQARAICESAGDLLHLMGQHAEAQALYERGLRHVAARTAGGLARARLHRKIGNSHLPRHEHVAAERAFDHADAALQEAQAGARAGARAGAQAGFPDDPEWCHEWLRAQADRTELYYWTSQPAKMAALLERMRPVLDRYGTPGERARLLEAVVTAGLRASRYAISDELLSYAREYLAAHRQLDDPAALARAMFTSGFVRLWHGDLDQAEEELREALAQGERIGDVALQTRAPNYLAVVCRKRGDVAGTRQWVEQAMLTAERAGMPEYAVQCRSNLAWVAWKQGRLDDAESIGQAALDEVQRTPALRTVNPFLWQALFPLLDIARRRGDLAQAVEHARGMLEPSMQRLPDALAAQLQCAVDSFARADLAVTRLHLDQSVILAQYTGYL